MLSKSRPHPIGCGLVLRKSNIGKEFSRPAAIRKVVLPPIQKATGSPSPSLSQPCYTFVSKTATQRRTDDVSPFAFNIAFPYRYNRPDIQFPEVGPLPSPAASNFQEIFNAKMAIASENLDYVIAEYDTKAKEIKGNVLTELIDYLQRATLNETQYKMFFDMIEKNLNRYIRPFPAILSAFDEEPIISDSSWCHLAMIYIILNKLAGQVPSLDRSYIKKVMRLLESPNAAERERVAIFITTCIVRFPIHRQFIHDNILNLLTSTMDKKNVFYISSCLNMLTTMYQELPITIVQMKKVIMPLIGHNMFRFFVPQMQHLITIVIADNDDLTPDLVMYAITHWPKSNPVKQLYSINFIIFLVEKLTQSQFLSILPKFVPKIAQIFPSNNPKVAEASILMWTSPAMSPIVKSFEKLILPLIYQQLTQVSRFHWNKSVQNSALTTLQIFSDMDHKLYNEVTAKHWQILDANEKQHTGWSLIARNAANNSIDFDILAIIDKINKEFIIESFSIMSKVTSAPILRE